MDADRIIDELGLAPHPEGGWYRETWRGSDDAASAIYFLLRRGERSAWHRVVGRSEIWHFYAGDPLQLWLTPGGDHLLGRELDAGHRPQVVVPPGAWQSAESLGEWTLVGATVSPAFEFSAFELAPLGWAPDQTAPSPADPEPVSTPNVDLMVTPLSGSTPARPAPSSASNTLAIDIGGTGLKASVLDDRGEMEHARVRVDTPYPLSPEKLVTVLADLIRGLPPFDRVSVGFPGMVRAGRILSAPHFISPEGPEGKPSPKLTKAWHTFNLQAAISQALGKPTRVANDADLQGSAVVSGEGLEVVITLGTGVGSALFYQGQLLPHLELAHHPLRKDKTYNEVLGDDARKDLGAKKWNKRVVEMIDTVRALTFFDHCYIGGGNATNITVELPADVSLVDNDAGILGGISLWHRT